MSTAPNHPQADPHNVAVQLDPVKVRDNLHKAAGFASLVAGFFPQYAAAVQGIAQVVDSDNAAQLIVTIAGLPDHLKGQAVGVALQAVQKHAANPNA